MGAAVVGANQSAIADDHGQVQGGKRGVQLARDGHSEVVAAASDERDFDAAPGRFGDGLAVRFGNLPAAVQQRAINVERNELHGHLSIVAGAKGLHVGKLGKGP